MGCIKLSYSWDTKEYFIECKKENAWCKMIELALNEIYIAMDGNIDDIEAMFYRENFEIVLQYPSWSEYCCYKFIEH